MIEFEEMPPSHESPAPRMGNLHTDAKQAEDSWDDKPELVKVPWLQRIPCRLPIITAVILPFPTFLLCYYLSYYVNDPPVTHPPLTFLSGAIDRFPARSFGSFFLTIMTIPTAIAIYVRLWVVSKRLDALPEAEFKTQRCCAPCACGVRTMKCCNMTCAILGAMAAIGGYGVCAWQLTVHFTTHIVFAALYFLGFYVVLIIQTIMDYNVGSNTSCIRHTRMFLLVLPPLSTGAGFIVNKAHGWDGATGFGGSWEDREPTQGEINSMQSYAIAEMVTFISYLGVIATYWVDLKNVTVSMQLNDPNLNEGEAGSQQRSE